ncbi:MAG: hypothetical protein JWQ71_877 [Pedosphaera sp.]|nr:hypothetical protein [Pedosphaera sp.]
MVRLTSYSLLIALGCMLLVTGCQTPTDDTYEYKTVMVTTEFHHSTSLDPLVQLENQGWVPYKSSSVRGTPGTRHYYVSLRRPKTAEPGAITFTPR